MDSTSQRAQTKSHGGIQGTGRRSRAPDACCAHASNTQTLNGPGFPLQEFFWNSARGLELVSNGIGNGKRTNPRFLPLLSPSAAQPRAGWSQMTWGVGGNLSIWKGN